MPEGNRPSEKQCGVPAEPGNFVTKCDASKDQSGVLEDQGPRDHKLQTPLNTLEVDHTAHLQHLSGLICWNLGLCIRQNDWIA